MPRSEGWQGCSSALPGSIHRESDALSERFCSCRAALLGPVDCSHGLHLFLTRADQSSFGSRPLSWNESEIPRTLPLWWSLAARQRLVLTFVNAQRQKRCINSRHSSSSRSL